VVRIERRTLSPTAINTYLQCPRKFYLRYIKKRPTKPSIHLIRGKIVHRTIHDFHTRNPGMSSQTPLHAIRRTLLGMFREHWQEAQESLDSLGLTGEEIQFYRDDSERMLMNFSHWFVKHGMPTPDLSEAKIVSKNLSLMGIVDAVHQWPEKVILVDYKTSKNPVITSDMERQAALYALLYQDKYKVVPEAVWIHFLKNPDDPQPVHIDEELLSYGRILIESVQEKTRSYDEHSYPCTCGGYCEEDFIRE
jgi:CRISPR/Cas system-associated exonuclease Cas4 (RecB family)